jgi:putative addiction module component (TIGR02574 family)
MTAEAIQVEALQLPPEERAKLLDALWDSLSPSDVNVREAAWVAESESRIAAVAAGLLPLRDAEAVFRDLRKNLRK